MNNIYIINKDKVKLPFMFDVGCLKSYIVNGNEYWTECKTYEATRDEDNDCYFVKTNFDNVGVIDAENLDDYFVYLS